MSSERGAPSKTSSPPSSSGLLSSPLHPPTPPPSTPVAGGSTYDDEGDGSTLYGTPRSTDEDWEGISTPTKPQQDAELSPSRSITPTPLSKANIDNSGTHALAPSTHVAGRSSIDNDDDGAATRGSPGRTDDARRGSLTPKESKKDAELPPSRSTTPYGSPQENVNNGGTEPTYTVPRSDPDDPRLSSSQLGLSSSRLHASPPSTPVAGRSSFADEGDGAASCGSPKRPDEDWIARSKPKEYRKGAELPPSKGITSTPPPTAKAPTEHLPGVRTASYLGGALPKPSLPQLEPSSQFPDRAGSVPHALSRRGKTRAFTAAPNNESEDDDHDKQVTVPSTPRNHRGEANLGEGSTPSTSKIITPTPAFNSSPSITTLWGQLFSGTNRRTVSPLIPATDSSTSNVDRDVEMGEVSHQPEPTPSVDLSEIPGAKRKNKSSPPPVHRAVRRKQTGGIDPLDYHIPFTDRWIDHATAERQRVWEKERTALQSEVESLREALSRSQKDKTENEKRIRMKLDARLETVKSALRAASEKKILAIQGEHREELSLAVERAAADLKNELDFVRLAHKAALGQVTSMEESAERVHLEHNNAIRILTEDRDKSVKATTELQERLAAAAKTLEAQLEGQQKAHEAFQRKKADEIAELVSQWKLKEQQLLEDGDRTCETLQDRYHAKNKQLQQSMAQLKQYQEGDKVAKSTEDEVTALKTKVSQMSEHIRTSAQLAPGLHLPVATAERSKVSELELQIEELKHQHVKELAHAYQKFQRKKLTSRTDPLKQDQDSANPQTDTSNATVRESGPSQSTARATMDRSAPGPASVFSFIRKSQEVPLQPRSSFAFTQREPTSQLGNGFVSHAKGPGQQKNASSSSSGVAFRPAPSARDKGKGRQIEVPGDDSDELEGGDEIDANRTPHDHGRKVGSKPARRSTMSPRRANPSEDDSMDASESEVEVQKPVSLSKESEQRPRKSQSKRVRKARVITLTPQEAIECDELDDEKYPSKKKRFAKILREQIKETLNLENLKDAYRLPTANRKEAEKFNASEGAQGGPDPDNLLVDFVDVLSSYWNEEVITRLAVLTEEALDSDSAITRSRPYIRKAIFASLTRAKGLWNKHRQQAKDDGTLETHEEVERRIRDFDSASGQRNRANSRQVDRLERRIQILEGLIHKAKRDKNRDDLKGYKWLLGLVKALGRGGMSTDESDGDLFVAHTMPWRGPFSHFMQDIDGKRETSEAFALRGTHPNERVRRENGPVSHRDPPKNLLRCLFDPAWLASQGASKLAKLQISDDDHFELIDMQLSNAV